MTQPVEPSINSQQHYETLLAEVYDWMQGGWDQRVRQSRELFENLLIKPGQPGKAAVDLGAGTGYQAIPLAELGFTVTAVDASVTMLAQLQDHLNEEAKPDGASSEAGPIHTVVADICRFAESLGEPADLVVCMGDTLSHLESHQHVATLIGDLHRSQPAGGRIVLGFRDASQPLVGDSRFLPVRSDDDRIFTCFIEEIDEQTVRIHDVVHTKTNGGFVQNVSSYRKIRLTSDWVVEQLIGASYQEPDVTTEMGMTIISARKPNSRSA